MKKLTIFHPVIVSAAVSICLLAYLSWSFYKLERPRGLRISPPEMKFASAILPGDAAVKMKQFAALSPASFSMAFGLDFYREPVAAVASKPAEIKPIETKPVVEKPVETVSAVDLAAIGYRLKGIIYERDGNSAAFVYDPDQKRVVIVRKQSGDALRLLEVFLRSIRLSTPRGDGLLELDKEAAVIGRSGAGAMPSSLPGSVRAMTGQELAREKAQRQETVSAPAIADMINSGHFNVRQHRSNFSVEVRNIPDSFVGYGLVKGDQIVGTNGQDFKRSQDIALELGKVSQRPVALKIIRNGKVMHLTAPEVKEAAGNSEETKP